MLINSYIHMDPDAVAFLNAQGNTNAKEKYALNRLVVDLKQAGIWTKFKAIYPFLGSTAAFQKWNLKDPRDLDAAFRLVFFGGWTHSSNGALPNGTNAYADTFLTLSAAGCFDDYHFAFYCVNNPTPDATVRVDMGRGAGVDGTYANMFIRLDNTNSYGGSSGGNLSVNRNIFSTNTDSRCFTVLSSISSTIFKLYKNGVLDTTNTTTQTNTASTSLNIYIGAQGNMFGAGQFSNKQCAFSSIGSGLTDSETANFYTIVQTFQTTLSRQV